MAIDLFGGCGGLTEGLKQAGFRVIGTVEIDSLAAETYQVNHTDTLVWLKDIRNLSVSEVKKRLNLAEGDLDLLAGCPPCQGFSSMRTLNGGRRIDDPQNDLIFDFLRFVKELMPKTVMMENVPGLANDDRIRLFWEELTALGYKGRHRVLNAADYGVPQRRRRMILLAGRGGEIEFADRASKHLTVEHAIKELPPAGKSGDPLHDLRSKERSDRIRELIAKIPKNGGSRTDIGEEYRLECHKRCPGFKDVYGRMSWEKVAPTITSGCFNPSKGRFLHPEEDRPITLREAALLQSFRRDYYFSLRRGKSNAAALIGNALPPEFIKCHALKVLEYLARVEERE